MDKREFGEKYILLVRKSNLLQSGYKEYQDGQVVPATPSSLGEVFKIGTASPGTWILFLSSLKKFETKF